MCQIALMLGEQSGSGNSAEVREAKLSRRESHSITVSLRSIVSDCIDVMEAFA